MKKKFKPGDLVCLAALEQPRLAVGYISHLDVSKDNEIKLSIYEPLVFLRCFCWIPVYPNWNTEVLVGDKRLIVYTPGVTEYE